MPDHTPEHKEQTQQGGMGGEKKPEWQKEQQGGQRQGDMGGQQPTGGDRERREESERMNS